MIAAYIAVDNPVAARKVSKAIRKTGNNLGRFSIGHYGRVEDTLEVGVSSPPYIIPYLIQLSESGKEEIVILRVIHAARNWPEGGWPV